MTVCCIPAVWEVVREEVSETHAVAGDDGTAAGGVEGWREERGVVVSRTQGNDRPYSCYGHHAGVWVNSPFHAPLFSGQALGLSHQTYHVYICHTQQRHLQCSESAPCLCKASVQWA